jgi:hypothetical protein
MKYGIGQGDNEHEAERTIAHPLPINGGETRDPQGETDYPSAGSPSVFILSPNGKSKR